MKIAWTEFETDFFKSHYGNLTAEEIAAQLGRSVHSVYNRAKTLNVRNSKWEGINDYSQLTEAQRGWIAGILDGEGCIFIDKRSKSASIHVNNTDFKMLEALKFMCGGTICLGRPAQGNWKEVRNWVLSRRENVMRLIDSVYPYLITKREAADKAKSHVSGRKVRT